MKLRDIVVEKAIVPKLASANRDDAITELIDALVAAGAVREADRDEFIKAVIRREKRGSTGFGHGVAVPHVKNTLIERLTVAVGISPTGVDFNALDKQNVHSIFLLLSPEDRPEEHLDAIQAIFGHLSQEQFRRFLRQATTVEHVLTLLEEADASQSVR